ncbi:hypothetical protein BROUX41_006549 [Berkeleyomyces rouxiae]|uniref:uncharacterized protein n=1 Tax=Berkeleyomyces rouxiae TaxID=2035830 RepID=UPI003B77E1B9
MKPGHRPPPLALTAHPVTLTAPTPAGDVEAARAPGTARDGSRAAARRTGCDRVLRIVTETAHTIVCMLMMLMLAFYLNYDEAAVNRSSGPPAIALILGLSIDMILNFYAIAHFDKPLSGAAALVKCVLIFTYIVIFLVYLASDGPFPSDYSFWGIKADYTSVIVYSLIWTISVWDLAVVVVNRKILLYWFIHMVDQVSQSRKDFEAASVHDKQFEAASPARVAYATPFVGQAL